MRRRRQHIEGQPEYLISISDLMAGLIFVFIIALVIFAIRLNSAAARHQLQVKRLSDAQEIRDSLLIQMQRTLLDRGLEVQIDLEKGVARIPERVLFASGRADLDDEGRWALGVVAATLAEILPRYAHTAGHDESFGDLVSLAGRLDAVFVEGHTDNFPLVEGAPFPDNWHLSAVRAINTYKEMIRSRPQLADYVNKTGQALFSVSGYAEKRPVASNDDEVGRAQNRRIDLRFVMANPADVVDPDDILVQNGALVGEGH